MIMCGGSQSRRVSGRPVDALKLPFSVSSHKEAGIAKGHAQRCVRQFGEDKRARCLYLRMVFISDDLKWSSSFEVMLALELTPADLLASITTAHH